MKYLAAYALLALSGKKDISTFCSTQPPTISSLSSDLSDLKLPMTTSTELSKPSRESPSINLLLMDQSALEPADPLPSLLLLLLLQRRIPLPLPKNNNPRRRKLPNPWRNPRRRWIWEICSVDSYTIELRITSLAIIALV